MNVYLMFKNKDLVLTNKFPPMSTDIIQDLELNVIFKTMIKGDNYIEETIREIFLTSLIDLDAILYRQEILRDCLENSAVARKMYQISIDAKERVRKNWLGIFTRSAGGVLSSAINLMYVYLDLLRELSELTLEHKDKFESEGFTRFFNMITNELTEEYLDDIESHLKQLEFRKGVLISAELGKGNEAANYKLRLPLEKKGNWVERLWSKRQERSFKLGERDNAGMRILSDIKDIAVNEAADSLGQATDHIGNFFGLLRTELTFYIGCLNLKERLDQLGCSITFPQPIQQEQTTNSFEGLYDLALALTMKKRIVGNDINTHHKKLFIITGANQGGKSTFLRSIGVAQLMMQVGMYVPAMFFSTSVSSGIYTHFRRKEDYLMKSGKLEEELIRMSQIVNTIRPGCLMLFNESFAATNEREGSEIALQITNALLEKNIKVFFVTHMYEFARILYDTSSKESEFLRANRTSDGNRDYRLVEGKPLPTSFGIDLYEKVFLSK